jgi:hypothetical protein
MALWRLQLLYPWEFAEIEKRKNGSTAILQGLGTSRDSQELPLFAATQQGWEANELLVRTGTQGQKRDWLAGEDGAHKTGHVVLEAKMTTTLQTILRYGAAIRRDLYRALSTLLQMQRERMEVEQFMPMNPEVSDEEN